MTIIDNNNYSGLVTNSCGSLDSGKQRPYSTHITLSSNKLEPKPSGSSLNFSPSSAMITQTCPLTTSCCSLFPDKPKPDYFSTLPLELHQKIYSFNTSTTNQDDTFLFAFAHLSKHFEAQRKEARKIRPLKIKNKELMDLASNSLGLKELDLSLSFHDNRMNINTFSAISNFHMLEKLNLSTANMDEENFMFLKELKLIDLSLSYTGIDTYALLYQLKDMLSLRCLNISGCKVKDSNLKLLSHHNLTSLSLNDSPKLTDKGLEHIKENPLKTLKVSRCHKVTNQGLRELRSGLLSLELKNLPKIDSQLLTFLNEEKKSPSLILDLFKSRNVKIYGNNPPPFALTLKACTDRNAFDKAACAYMKKGKFKDY